MSKRKQNYSTKSKTTSPLMQNGGKPYLDQDNKIVIPIKRDTTFSDQIQNLLLGKYSNMLDKTNKEVFSTFLDVDAMQDAQKGTRIPFVSTLYGNFLMNPSGVSIGTFQKMVQTDNQVRESHEMAVATIIDSIGEYYNKDKKIEEFMREQFRIVKGGKDEIFRKGCAKMWSGFSVCQMETYRDKNGLEWVEDLLFMPPLSVQFTADAQGATDGIFQYVYNYPYAGTQNALSIMYTSGNADSFVSGSSGPNFGIDSQASLGDMDYPFRTNFINTFGLVEINLEKTLHFIYDTHNGHINPYGYSLLRPSYPFWLIKTLVLRLLVSAMQRCANPMLIGYADARKVIEAQVPISAVDALYNSLQSYTEESAIVLPGLKGQLFDIEVVDYTGDFTVYDRALQYLDKGLAQSHFSSAIGSSSDQSYAAATAQNSIYSRMMKSIATGLSEEVLSQFCGYLIKKNFDENATDFGWFDTKLQNLDDQLKIAKIVEGLTLNGYMNPDFLIDLNAVRKQTGRSELSPKEFEEYKKTKQEAQMLQNNLKDSKMDNSGKSNTKDSADHYNKKSVTEIN